MSVYCCFCLFRYRLNPEAFGYTLVFTHACMHVCMYACMHVLCKNVNEQEMNFISYHIPECKVLESAY